MLSAVHVLLPRKDKETLFGRFDRAVKGLLAATPIALGAGYVFGAVGIMAYGHRDQDLGFSAFLLTGIACFSIWSLGFWIGLRWQTAEPEPGPTKE
jgi:hypothetical protein